MVYGKRMILLTIVKTKKHVGINIKMNVDPIWQHKQSLEFTSFHVHIESMPI